jgi:hypothetical protein
MYNTLNKAGQQILDDEKYYIKTIVKESWIKQ